MFMSGGKGTVEASALNYVTQQDLKIEFISKKEPKIMYKACGGVKYSTCNKSSEFCNAGAKTWTESMNNSIFFQKYGKRPD